MTPGAFKCSKCDRSFSMAAHLARHRNTIHGGGGRKAPRAKMKRGPGRPRGRVGRPPGRRGRPRMSAPGGDGAAQLLSQMQAYFSELTSRRTNLDSQIVNLQQAMGSLGGSAPARRGRPPGRRPGRPAGRRMARRGRPAGGKQAREGSLKDMIAKVLRQGGQPQTPRDIATSVIRAGYKTKTHDLSKAVSNALPQMRNIRRVGRGLYAA